MLNNIRNFAAALLFRSRPARITWVILVSLGSSVPAFAQIVLDNFDDSVVSAANWTTGSSNPGIVELDEANGHLEFLTGTDPYPPTDYVHMASVSSVWGIAEKLLLPKTQPAAALATTAKDVLEPEVVPAPPRSSSPADRGQDAGPPPSGGGIWSQILKASEKPDPSRRSDRRRNS